MNLSQELKSAGQWRAKQEKALAKVERKKKTEDLRYILNSIKDLVEALALGVTSGYAIYSGWYATLPKWGSVALLVAGSFIALRAFVEFVKFLNRRR